jgi:hypothetical protein
VFTLKKIFFSRSSRPISIKLNFAYVLANMTQVSDVAPGPLVVNCISVKVPLEIFSTHMITSPLLVNSCKIWSILSADDLSAGIGGLCRATPAVTRWLGFCGII